MARIKEKALQFKVVLEQDEDGIYVASVPELPGCYTQGKTLEEVRKRIKEAIQLVLEEDKDLKKDKLVSSCLSCLQLTAPHLLRLRRKTAQQRTRLRLYVHTR
ncbi:MAG: type II toxin-antitoxin system HicB family antitoxin [Candidatus Yanofskybacteria bacterium]|nr:type II toxin-antitoxin system HicB family antitoxin [Candidatus Yanofskybacteria bacterium]